MNNKPKNLTPRKILIRYQHPERFKGVTLYYGECRIISAHLTPPKRKKEAIRTEIMNLN